METYFTFPDGVLRYDCAACRQRCCRGKGIALGDTELTPLLGRASVVASVLRLRPGGTLAAVNLADGCWFLRPDGLCALEAEQGRASKPATCRLFPFNRIYRLGDVRIVDVNTVLCPLEAGADGMRHAALLAEIADLGASPLLDVPVPAPAELPPDWLARERAAADAAQRLAGEPAALCRATGDPDAEALVGAWAPLLGLSEVERAAAEAPVAPRVALLLPSLRWDRLFRRPVAPYPLLAARLPRRLRALTLLGAAAARLQGQPPSLRGLSELWQGQAAVLDVLERWAEPVRLAAPRFDADVPPLLQPALGALLAGAFRGGRVLGELVEAAARALPAPQRPLALALAASQLNTLFPPG